MRIKTALTLLSAVAWLSGFSAVAQNAASSNSSPGLSQDGVKLLLADGTPVRLRTVRQVCSCDARVGDLVNLEVLDEVRVDDTVVVPKGGSGLAIVTLADQRKAMGRGGKVDLGIDSVKLADGTKAALRAVKQPEPGQNQNSIVAAMAANSVSSAPLVFARGRDVMIPQGTEFTAYVNGGITLSAASFQPSALESKSTAAAIANSATELYFASVPNLAEIQIDGKFVGTTPSTVIVRSGPHEVGMRLHGFETWRQTVTAAGEKLVFDIRLQPDSVTGSTVSNCSGVDCTDVPLGDVARQNRNNQESH